MVRFPIRYWLAVAVTAGLAMVAVDVLRAAPAESASQPPQSPSVTLELKVLELPERLCRKLGLQERLPGGGSVLSESEARKLTEGAQNDRQANVLLAPRIVTRMGQDAAIRTSAGKRDFACQVLPQIASDGGDIMLRITPVLQEQSTPKAHAPDMADLFTRCRVSITAQLKSGESVAFGGWKTGQSDGKTIVVVATPLLAASPLSRTEPDQQGRLIMGGVTPRIIIQEEEEERLEVVAP